MTMLAVPSAARASAGTVVDVGYPTAQHSAVLSPTHAACIAQDLLEEILLDHVESLESVTLLRGHEVVGVVVEPTSARVAVRGPSGEVRQVEAAYVVGADGSRSAVRRALGIELHGPSVLMEGARIEFHAPVWDVLGDHRHLLYAVTEPGSSGVLLPAGRGDRWIFAVSHGSAGDLPEPPTEQEVRERLLRATDLEDHQVRATRFDRVAAGAQVATRFSHGRAFLVGDAAHRVTPRGGTGLNIALADGHDLGWKLGWVLRGWAPTSLLDTYEAERRPLVEHNVHRSADPLGSRRPAISEIQVDLGGRLTHAWVAPGVSTLDLLGDGLTLLGSGPQQGGWAGLRAAQSPPVTVEPVDLMTARALGLGPQGATLVRPDGVPLASWWSPPSVADLEEAASAVLAGAGSPLPSRGESAA